MDLYLLKFNNYYNRIVKKFDTLAEYLSAPYYNGDIVENVSFDPNDNVNTYQIVNTNYSCDCVNNKKQQVEGADETAEKYSKLFDKMNLKFQLYQVEGTVPLQTLTIIFSKVGINEHFTNLIMGYIKKKTLKIPSKEYL